MICVFGAFILGEGRDLKLLGFGLAFTILIDCSACPARPRAALMELMGKANWSLPSWLRWLPDVRVEAEAAPQFVPQGGGGGE